MNDKDPAPRQRVLVIEDDPLFQRLHHTYLERSEFRVTFASCGEAALAEFSSESPDAVLLDLGLPDMSGFQVLEQIRSQSDVPIVIITSYNSPKDILRGFELGVDDYLTKPFDPYEMVARLKAVVRRASPEKTLPPPKTYHHDSLHIDFRARRVEVEGTRVRLSMTEFTLLTVFVRHEGHVLTHEQLLTAVWGNEYSDHLEVLRTTIHRLRHKIEPHQKPTQFIFSVIGVGYCFDPQ